MALSQAADGQPDCTHIRQEVVSADERNRSLTFGLRKTQFSQLVWTADLRNLVLKIVSPVCGFSSLIVLAKKCWDIPGWRVRSV